MMRRRALMAASKTMSVLELPVVLATDYCEEYGVVTCYKHMGEEGIRLRNNLIDYCSQNGEYDGDIGGYIVVSDVPILIVDNVEFYYMQYSSQGDDLWFNDDDAAYAWIQSDGTLEFEE